MTQPLIHILGGGLWQLPTIRKAKALGYRVLVSDMYPNPPGFALADLHEQVDITDREATLKVAERHQIDGIICDTTDVGVPTMAYVAEKLGLPGIGLETALNFTNKYRMRDLTSKAGLANPPFRKATTLAKARGFGFPLPFVVKPVDSQSSRGVHVIRNSDEIDYSILDALKNSRSGEIIVEGFLDGIEVTVESVVVAGRVHTVGISDKDHYAHRPEVANRLTYPAAFPVAILQSITNLNAAVVAALGLKNGVTHAEYMVVGETPYLVEIAARGAGSYVYSDIGPYLAGVDIPSAYLQYAVGGDFTATPDEISRAANLAFFDFPAGKVKGIYGVEAAKTLPGVHTILLEFSPGDFIQPPNDDRSRIGLVVVFGNTRDQVLATTRQVMETVKVTYA